MIEIELLVGTMGLEAILADKPPKYSAALMARAAATLKEFRAGADTFASSNHPGPLPKENYEIARNFEEIVTKLEQSTAVETVADGLASWPAELQMPLIVQMADVRAYLAQQVPTQVVTGAFSGFKLPPSDSDKFRFLWQANLVDDVTKFADLLNSGAITPIESALMRTLFPMTHDYLLIEVLDRVMAAAVDDKLADWEGSWRKPALSGFLGVPLTTFEDTMQMQTGMAEKTAGRPKGAGSLQMAQINQTGNQAMEARTIDRS